MVDDPPYRTLEMTEPVVRRNRPDLDLLVLLARIVSGSLHPMVTLSDQEGTVSCDRRTVAGELDRLIELVRKEAEAPVR